MRKIKIFSFKVLAICFMMGFGIFFALDVANKGMERLHPPAKESKSKSTAEPATAAIAAAPAATPVAKGVLPATIAAPGTKGVLPATTPGAPAKESKQQQSTVSTVPTARSGVTAATARESAAADAIKAAAALKAAEASEKAAQTGAKVQPQVKNPPPTPPVVLQESFFNRLSNGIGGLLRSAAEAIVRFVVSIFASVLG